MSVTTRAIKVEHKSSASIETEAISSVLMSENFSGLLLIGVKSSSKVTADSLAKPSTDKQSGRFEVISNSMMLCPMPKYSKASMPISVSSGNT